METISTNPKLMICRYSDFCSAKTLIDCEHKGVHIYKSGCKDTQWDCAFLSKRTVYHREKPWDNGIYGSTKGMSIHCVEVEVHMERIGQKELAYASMKNSAYWLDRGMMDDITYLLNQGE